MAILASAVAGSEGKRSPVVEQYAHDHLAMAFTPMAIAATQGLRRSVPISQLPVLTRTILDLRQYTASPQAATDTPQERETRLRDGFDQLLDVFGLDLPDNIASLLREDFVKRVLDAIAEYAGQTAKQSTSGR